MRARSSERVNNPRWCLHRAMSALPVSSTGAHSDDPDDTKPEEGERHHVQLHVGNDNPPAMLLVEAFDAGISR